MKIDFTKGANRPLDPVHATKLRSEVGIHVRRQMPLQKKKWKTYSKSPLKHILPEAIKKIKVRQQTSIIFY